MIVIYNPAAGKRRASRLWRVLDILNTAGLMVTVQETSYSGHASELARSAALSGARLVVAAGGDGTIAEVAQGLCGSATSLGIIPLGTANVLAHELGLPFSAVEVASALAFGRTQPHWPGLARNAAGDRLFVQMLGAGLDAQVVHFLSKPLKRAIGRGAYVVQTLREVCRYDFAPIELRIDGREMEAASVIVSKGCLYGGPYLLAPGAQPREPGFTVALFRNSGPLSALLYGAALPFNLLPWTPGLSLVKATTIDILGAGSVKLQSDGDEAGFVPVSIRDAPGAISIVVAGRPHAATLRGG